MLNIQNSDKNPNSHITAYLTHYINKKEIEFAVLLTGPWGCGKTYYVEQFIKTIREGKTSKTKYGQKNYIFKISLFGLKTVDDLDTHIGQEILSALSNKFVQGLNTIGKVATTGGEILSLFKTPIAINSEKVRKVTEELSKELEHFLLDKNKKQITFIFDDLERTDIPLKELLGRINAFVERDHIKVILITNERELIKQFIHSQEKNEYGITKESAESEKGKTKPYINEEDRKNQEIYVKFKEKVIGKTFEIQSDFDQVLDYFLKNDTCKIILSPHINILKKIYSSAEPINFRQLKQALDDFAYLWEELDEQYQKNQEFAKHLIHTFFALKKMSYDTVNLQNLFEGLKPSGQDPLSSVYEINFYMKGIDDNLKENMDKKLVARLASYEKYRLETILFPEDVWVDILFKNNLQRINDTTQKLAYFISKEKPLWMQCHNFFTLDQDRFNQLSQTIIANFDALKKEDYYEELHIIDLLIKWSELKLISKTPEEITGIAKKFLKKHAINWVNEYSTKWKDFQKHPDQFDFNDRTEQSFYSNENSDFQNIKNSFQQKQDETVKIIQQEQEKKTYNTVLNYMKEDDVIKLHDLLLYSNQSIMFFHIEPNKFLKTLFELKNRQMTNFNYVLGKYYLNKNTPNNPIKAYHNIASELNFWHDVKVGIKSNLNLSENQPLPKTIKECISQRLLETIENIISTIQSILTVKILEQNNYPKLEKYLCYSNQNPVFIYNNRKDSIDLPWNTIKVNLNKLQSVLLKRYEYITASETLKEEKKFWTENKNKLAEDHSLYHTLNPFFEQIIKKIKQRQKYLESNTTIF